METQFDFLLRDPRFRRLLLKRHLARPSMLNLRFTVGVGVGFSGACALPLVWRARKPLPSALRSSAALAFGLARQRAPVPEHRLPVLGLCLRPQWMPPSLLFSNLSSVSLPPCVSHRGLFNTTHRFSLHPTVANFQKSLRPSPPCLSPPVSVSPASEMVHHSL